jgi:hypothetical protein
MKLYEFFGKIDHNIDSEKDQDPSSPGKEEEQELGNQVFWYILDHDNLHKKHALPLAKQIKKEYSSKKEEGVHDWKLWMPMVKEGCAKYFEENDVQGDPNDVFNKEFCIDLCKRLADQYHEDITKDEYDLGH